MICKCCSKDIQPHGFTEHLRHKHNMDPKTYYDKYLKTESEGICLECGKMTPFLGIKKGYQRFCCIQCASKSNITKEKRIKFNLKKYGGPASSCSPIVREKMIKTCMEKFGVPCSFMADSVKEKIKDTLKYRDYESINKKTKKTKLERYGNENYINVKKIKETKLEKYGSSNYVNSEKAKETRIKHFGVSHHLQLPEYLEKQQKTNLEKYGVKCALQNYEILCKAKKKYNFDGRMFDSKPEIEFYKKLKENFTDFEYQPNISFEYEYNGTIHNYHPDFRIGRSYYELKGSHFFDENGKMINPWDRTQDAKYEAKHQCMIINNIRIILV